MKAQYESVDGSSGRVVWNYLWNGMMIVDKSVTHHGLDQADLLEVPLKRHRDLIYLYARIMYTSHQAKLCPGGLLCLVAVNTELIGDGISSEPYPCPVGSYCLTASNQVIGTALCPIGYYCPLQSTYPQPTSTGFFTENSGAVES